MKILQINKYFYLRGGSERYFFGLSKILENNGHQVAHFSMKHERNLESKYAKYFTEKIELDKFSLKSIIKIFYNHDAVNKLDKLMNDFKPDVAHLHNIDRQLGPAIINLLKKRGIPVVMTLHDFKAFCPKGTLYNKRAHCRKCLNGNYYNCLKDKCIKESYLKSALGMLEFYWQRFFLMAYGKVDTFHAPSLYMKNIAVSSGISSEKIFDLVYPIEAREDSNGTEKVNEEYLLYFGRLSEEKGIDVLIRALSRTKIGIKLKIAGEGELKDGLMKISDALGLTKRIEFLGFQNGEKLEKLISGAEAVVIPSLWPENMPYSLLESMASGKTIIASKTGGIPERIVDESSGYLFSIGNINELAEKIDSAVSEKNAMLGQKARDSIKNFNTKKHYEELVKMYNSLIFAKLKHY